MTPDASLVDRITRLSPETRLLLEQRLTSVITPVAGPVAHGDVDIAPTSYAQRSQWFVNQLDLDNPFFNKTDAVRIRGPLDVDALRRAVSALVARHASLRTGFRLTDDGPVQVVHPAAPIDVPVIDLPSGLHQDAELQRHLAAEQRRPFDLENGPMYRAHLIRLGADDCVLARTNHHIAFDRWSSAIANAELSELYSLYSSGEERGLEPLPYQYTDYALWQRSHLDEEAFSKHLEFAAAHLAGVPQILDLPIDHPRPTTQSHRGASYHLSLDPNLVQKVRETARAVGATPFMVCLAGFGVLVGRYARTDQFLLGVPAAGRNAEASDRLIGLFINSMVIRLDLRGDPTFTDLVARVRTAALGAMSHQELPFEILVENLASERVPGRTPVFQVMLDYVNTPAAALTLGSLDLDPVPIADEASVYDINLYLYDDATDIRAKWEYRSDLF
ncbi:MAG TPA: condensation domain-containing protein, partial [Acidimicrobiia bacterium]